MYKQVFFLVISLFLISGCNSETAEKAAGTAELLIGRWELDKAIRNGKPTQNLNGAFFAFLDQSTMATNFYGQEEKAAYVLEENIIHQSGKNKTDYTIDLIDDNKLVLVFVTRNIKFNIAFNKTKTKS